jgi:hypothetical protein
MHWLPAAVRRPDRRPVRQIGFFDADRQLMRLRHDKFAYTCAMRSMGWSSLGPGWPEADNLHGAENRACDSFRPLPD